MWLVESTSRPTVGICTNPLGVRPIGERFKNNYRWNGFVTTPVPFYFNFPKNHDFDDLGKAMMNILNLMCSNGPGWWVGAQRWLERGLESSRSNLASKTVKWSFYWGFNHCGGIPDTLRHDVKIYIRGRNGAKSRSQDPIGCTTIIFRGKQ